MKSNAAPLKRSTRPAADGQDIGTAFALIGFVKFSALIRVIPRIRTIAVQRIFRLIAIVLASVLMQPLSLWQTLRYRRQIEEHRIYESPIFIIGHWRSGTTHLHNLMSQDPQFACVRMAEAIAPTCSLAGGRLFRGLMDRIMSGRRPMDNMRWPMDAPQEDEIGLAKMTPYSWYLQFLFPNDALSIFQHYVLLERASPQKRSEIQATLRRLLSLASLREHGRRLLIKNPVHSARIPMLLALFPNARFIFLHRHPHEVFSSTINFHNKILPLTSLQVVNPSTIKENVLVLYESLLRRYLRDREMVSADRLIEVSFTELESQPLETVEKVYRKLAIPGHDQAQQKMKLYLKHVSSYEKNDFPPLSQADVQRVNSRWAFAFSQWGY